MEDKHNHMKKDGQTASQPAGVGWGRVHRWRQGSGGGGGGGEKGGVRATLPEEGGPD